MFQKGLVPTASAGTCDVSSYALPLTARSVPPLGLEASGKIASDM